MNDTAPQPDPPEQEPVQDSDEANAPQDSNTRASKSVASFEDLANQKPPTLVEEFLQFIVQEKKWWLIPIVLALGTIGVLAMLTSTGAAPFIYTLF